MLRIRLFGHLNAELDGDPLRMGAVGSALPLMFYLLLHRHEPQPRARVAFDLWPDSEEGEALGHLRRHLHLLQENLPSAPPERPWLLCDRGTVRWNPDADWWLDVAEFEALCASGTARELDAEARAASAAGGAPSDRDRVARAVELYRGDLLADFYDDWLLAERERLGEMFAGALARLVGLEVSSGNARAAAAAADRLVRHDELREESHRLVIGLRYVAGDRASALDAYNHCRDVLARELDVEPMPETTRLADAIRACVEPRAVLELLRVDLPRALDLAAALPGHVPSNLPQSLTSFVGRIEQLDQLCRLLAEHRLVTLTGPAGCGKSRLALEVANRLLAAEEDALAGSAAKAEGLEAEGAIAARLPLRIAPHGVWWVDLTSVADGAHVWQAVAAPWGIRECAGASLPELLEREVRPRQMLLVLDNVERVVLDCALLVDRLLRASAGLRVLAASRELLGVPGETAWLVPPLSLPPPIEEIPTDRVLEFEAPRLLVERAGGALAFALTHQTAPLVAAVCRQLDGNPLSLELAAARLRDMPVTELADGLDERFALLTRGPRTAPERHQTLGAAIDWSHDLLGSAEKALFRRLAAFRDGWTLSAAEAVCGGDGIAADDVLDLLAALVDKSLVVVRAADGGRRHEMQASIQQYAEARLDESGEGDAVRSRHLAHFLGLAELAEPHLAGGDESEWLGRLESEHGNLRAAMEWATRDDRDPEPARRLALALWRYWIAHGHFSEGRAWLELLAEGCGAAPLSHTCARIVYCAASVALWQGDYDAAGARYASALAMFGELGDRQGMAWALNDLGMLAVQSRDYDRATDYYERSLAIKRELGAVWDIARSLVNLGELAWRVGDYDRADTLYLESLSIVRATGAEPDPELAAAVCNNRGEVARCRGENDRAEALYKESLAAWHALGDRYNMSLAVDGLGGIASAMGNPVRAATLFAGADALRSAIGVPLDPGNRAERERMEAPVRAALRPDEWAAAASLGSAMSTGELVRFALEGEIAARGTAP